MYDVAAKLDLEDIYRDNLAIIKLFVGPATRLNAYSIMATHGNGGGRQTGASVNRYERFAANWEGIDVFYFGHSHKPFVTKPNKLYIDAQRGDVKQRNTIVTTGASWLAYGGYPVRQLMDPAHQADPDQPITTVYSAKHSNKQIRFIW